jgi:hypothetical protein
VIPATDTITILFTQVGVESPVVPDLLSGFWRYSVSS